MSDFVAVVEDAMAELLEFIEVVIPYSKGDELNSVHEQGNVDVVDYREQGTYVRALVPASVANRLAPFSVQRKSSLQPSTGKAATADDGIDWVALGRGRHRSTQP